MVDINGIAHAYSAEESARTLSRVGYLYVGYGYVKEITAVAVADYTYVVLYVTLD